MFKAVILIGSAIEEMVRSEFPTDRHHSLASKGVASMVDGPMHGSH